MIRRFVARVATLALAGAGLLLITPPAEAAPAPQGSYQQTCRDISANQGALSAECKTRNGNWNDSELDGYRTCSGDISNDNGRLACDRDTGGRNDSHSSSNDNPGVRNNDRDRGGNDSDTNARYVGNYPRGTYRDTCRNIHTDGDDLIAECRTWDGEWHRSKLDGYDKCGQTIANDDERLRCGSQHSGGNWQPNGSYQDSCRNIRVVHGDLQAECRAHDGWKTSELESVRDCRGDVANDHGQLVCAGQGDDEHWGRITLFEHARFHGAQRDYGQDAPDLGPFADRASSASVSGGSWLLCTRRNYRGRCVTISDSVRDFVDIGLNDRIESIRRVK